jgi:hypothetical protein
MSRVLKSPRHGLSLQENAGSMPAPKRTTAVTVRVLSIPSFSDHPIANATELECLKLSLNRIYMHIYRGADKSLALPTSHCILFDGENISFDASPIIYI